MGREQHILLAVLGLLAGAFVGVLSMKLLSPRPPAGAGADIHDEVAIATPAAIVEPPTLSRAEEPRPLVAKPASFEEVVADDLEHDAAPGDGRRSVAPRRLDPIITDEAAPAAKPEEPHVFPRRAMITPSEFSPPDRGPPAEEAPTVAVTSHAALVPPAASRSEATLHVAAVGETWWSLAERLYGDGRLYRALFAWNRAVNPRVSLVPGTPLEIPPLSRLATAWPDLIPPGTRSEAPATLR